MALDPKGTRLARKNAGAKGNAVAKGKNATKRVLKKINAPPPHGFPATAPGSVPPDERKPGTREHGSRNDTDERASRNDRTAADR